jgi:hypothetical protein
MTLKFRVAPRAPSGYVQARSETLGASVKVARAGERPTTMSGRNEHHKRTAQIVLGIKKLFADTNAQPHARY